MTLDVVREWISTICLAASILLSFVVFRRQASKEAVREAKERYDLLSKQVDTEVATVRSQSHANEEKLLGIGERLSNVEGELKHLPTKDQVHQLQLSMSDLSGTVRELTQKVAGISATTTRVEDFLLEQGRK